MSEPTREPATIAVVISGSQCYIEHVNGEWHSWEEVRCLATATKLQLIAQGADYATLVNTATAASKRFSAANGNYRWEGPIESGFVPTLELAELGWGARWDGETVILEAL